MSFLEFQILSENESLEVFFCTLLEQKTDVCIERLVFVQEIRAN